MKCARCDDEARYISDSGEGRCEEHRRTSSGCFIATAAYGTPFCNELNVLRTWRDASLKTNAIGNWFVKLYYITSPSVARYIEDRPLLKKIVRTLLNLFVNYLKKKS